MEWQTICCGKGSNHVILSIGLYSPCGDCEEELQDVNLYKISNTAEINARLTTLQKICDTLNTAMKG